MKKVLFLLLFLLVLGAANVSAQVRIGGDEAPNAAAVLDLNADDTNDGTKGLALPRVSLASNKDKLVYSDLLEGMLVYNTNIGMTDGDGVGVYYWDGSEWVKPAGGSVYEGSTSVVLSGNSFQRAALTGDVTADANSNATTIANNAVTSAKIQNNAINSDKIQNGSILTTDLANQSVTRIKTSLTVAVFEVMTPAPGNTVSAAYPTGCSATNAWCMSNTNGHVIPRLSGSEISLLFVRGIEGSYTTVRCFCFP